MIKGIGRYLGRESISTTTGGKDFFRYDVRPRDLVKSDKFPDNGIYEVEIVYAKSCDVCDIQPFRVRRVNMRYLTNKQRVSVTDISPKPSQELQRFRKELEKIFAA